jgi:Family of unknown function (DUF5317)
MGGVLLVLLTIITSVVVGLVRGGVASRLVQANLRLPVLLVIGAALQLGAVLATTFGVLEGIAPWMLLLGTVALLGFAVANHRQPGMLMFGVGVFCNLLVVALNGGMPVTEATLEKAGIEPAGGIDAARPDALHIWADARTRLLLLGDLFAVRPLRTVVSLGDIAQLAGLFLLVQGVMLHGARSERPPRYEMFDYRVR